MVDDSVKISERPGWFVTPKSRRIAEFFVADGTLLRLFQRPGVTWSVEANPLPADARIVGVEYALIPGGWRIFIESETLRDVPENELPPMVPPMTLHVQTDQLVSATASGEER